MPLIRRVATPPRSEWVRAKRIAWLLSVALTLGAGSAPEATPQTLLSTGQVRISGTAFLRDGTPWLAKGVDIDGRGTPKGALNKQIVAPGQRQAEARFGREVILAAKEFGADTIRLPVSQAGLRRGSSIYDSHYASEVIDAVHMARGLGLNVIVVMQWEAGSGAFGEPNMPAAPQTVDAWAALAPTLLGDNGILLEPFNEPGLTSTPDHWRIWQAGMNAAIQKIRGAGFTGVLLIEGLTGGQILSKSPPIADPLHQTGYAVHVYFNSSIPSSTLSDWDRNFGTFCRTAPCMVTEWMVASGAGGPNSHGVGCNNQINDAAVTKTFLAYLNARKIGLSAWALDYPDTIMVDNSLSTPTSFAHFTTCAASRKPFGAGQLVKDYFRR